jgi:hypothetical protein
MMLTYKFDRLDQYTFSLEGDGITPPLRYPHDPEYLPPTPKTGAAGNLIDDLYSFWSTPQPHAKEFLRLGAKFVEIDFKEAIIKGRTGPAIPDFGLTLDSLQKIHGGWRLHCFGKEHCCDPVDFRLHADGSAQEFEFYKAAEAKVFFEAAIVAGLYGTRIGAKVHLQNRPPSPGFSGIFIAPVSALTVERPDVWVRALELAEQITGMTYMERQPNYSGCGGSEGSDTPITIGRVYIPEGGMSWLLHEIGHWVAATDNERSRPNYGLGSEEHGINAARELEAHAFENIVLAPFGDSREMTPEAERTGVAFHRAGPIDRACYLHIEQRVEIGRLEPRIGQLRAIFGEYVAWQTAGQ